MITRRQVLKRAAAAGPALALGGGALANSAAAATKATGPAAGKNVVIFITDQDRAIQHFPDNWAEENLPGLTRLQQNGVTFENAFCSSCMCSPSRASMFTGYFPAQHGVKYTLEEDMPAPQYPQVELPTNLKNVASVMSASGYDVVYKGKWHLSKPAGDEFAPSDLTPYGFGRWNPPDAGADQSIPQEGGGLYDNDGRYMDSTGDVSAGEEGILQYLTEVAPNSDKPFCLIISLVNPHDVLLYPKNYVAGGYDDSWLEGDIGLPPTVDEDLSTKPDAQANFKKIFNLTGALNTRQKRLDYINFYGNLMKEVDGYLVEVMNALDTTGLTQDTIVIRTSDHGEMGLSHGTMRQKNFNAYEETMRVPMVYSNPDLPVGTTCDAMVSHVDLLPTLAGLVGAPRSARAKWQGKDYSKLVTGKSKKPVQDYVAFTFDDYQAGQKQGPYVKAPQHVVAIREKNWKIAKYYDANRQVAPQWELYHLKHDKFESKNLAAPRAKRNRMQELNFKRLKKKLAKVERSRLQPLPHQAFSVRSCTLRGDTVETKLRAPGRGKVTQRASARINGKRVDLGKKSKKVVGSGARVMRLQLDERARRLAREGAVEIKVVTTFLPNGGTPNSEVRKLKLKRRSRRALETA